VHTKLPLFASIVACSACATNATTAKPRAFSPPRAVCGQKQSFNGVRCRDIHHPKAALVRAAALLSKIHIEEALSLLQRLGQGAPLGYESHVQRHRLLGVAHSYLDQHKQALEAFHMLLALDPRHVLPYTLSPKTTLLFDQARKDALREPATALRVVWPRDARTDRFVSIELEAAADPRRVLHAARLYYRLSKTAWRHADLRLQSVGRFVSVRLPALATNARGDRVLELYVVCFDRRGNESLRWNTAPKPHAITLRFIPRTPWYRRWWIWAVGGVVAAAAATTSVYAATRPAPITTDGAFTIYR
jgi:tetratricopeptide (TPR) repeat protein